MKRLILLLVFQFALFTIHFASAQTEVEPFVPGSTLEGVTYYLPRTAFRVTIIAEKTTTRPGDFCKYADRYLRLKNVTLGYTLPQKLTRKAYIDKLRFYVSLENYLTFDHLNGIPIDVEEISGYSYLNSSNYNSSFTGVGAPAFKSASLGVQLTF